MGDTLSGAVSGAARQSRWKKIAGLGDRGEGGRTCLEALTATVACGEGRGRTIVGSGQIRWRGARRADRRGGRDPRGPLKNGPARRDANDAGRGRDARRATHRAGRDRLGGRLARHAHGGAGGEGGESDDGVHRDGRACDTLRPTRWVPRPRIGPRLIHLGTIPRSRRCERDSSHPEFQTKDPDVPTWSKTRARIFW